MEKVRCRLRRIPRWRCVCRAGTSAADRDTDCHTLTVLGCKGSSETAGRIREGTTCDRIGTARHMLVFLIMLPRLYPFR